MVKCRLLSYLQFGGNMDRDFLGSMYNDFFASTPKTTDVTKKEKTDDAVKNAQDALAEAKEILKLVIKNMKK